jgi:hypothetical protein
MPAPMSTERRAPFPVLPVAICAFAYLYVFPYQSALNNPNENVRLYMTAALVDDGVYEIDGPRQRWGWVNDAAVHDGHHYSVKAPGSSLLAVPGYALYRGACRATGRPFDRTEALWCARLTGSILPTLAFLAWLAAFLRRRAEDDALADACFYSIALGSLLYGYGMLLVSHTLSAAAAFGAFMLLSETRAQGSRVGASRAFASGLLAAAVTWLEYPGLPASIVLTVYACVVLWPRGGWRPLLAYAVGGLIPLASMMHFQWRAFGSPFTPGHLMVENEAFRAIHEEGVYGAVGPSAEALYGLLIDPGAGLFPLTPVLVLGLWGLSLQLRDAGTRADAVCAAAIVALTVLAISSMAHWRGGWTIGPRYLALCVPFLGVAALPALERIASTAPGQARALALGALAAGLAASGALGAYYPHLPPEITRPLPQLMAVLIGHGYAPRNAGNLLGAYGGVSMLPLLVAALLALGHCLRGLADLRSRALVGAGAALLASALLAPGLSRPDSEPGVRGAVAFVTRRWTPAGHDRAAVLRLELRRQREAHHLELERLAVLYEAEGRDQEARRARAGKL